MRWPWRSEHRIRSDRAKDDLDRVIAALDRVADETRHIRDRLNHDQ